MVWSNGKLGKSLSTDGHLSWSKIRFLYSSITKCSQSRQGELLGLFKLDRWVNRPPEDSCGLSKACPDTREHKGAAFDFISTLSTSICQVTYISGLADIKGNGGSLKTRRSLVALYLKYMTNC